MIFNEKVKIQLKDIEKGNYIKNKGILEIFENVATHHSDLVGYGPNSIKETGISWILFDWKIKVIKRPKYGQTLSINTWGRLKKKVYTYRDFEMYDEDGNLCVIGTSKWAIVNIETNKIEKITDEIYERYQLEEKDVFNVGELEKISEQEEYSKEFIYHVSRRDIDLNSHMHNLYYLDLAYEVLPEEVYKKRPFNEVRINYKKEVKLGDIVRCRYTFFNNNHIITICNNKDINKIHAIITLK